MFGFCEREGDVEKGWLLTFFYQSPNEVDAMYKKLKDHATTKPVKNDKYEIQMQEVVSFINQRNNELNMLFVLAHIPEDPKASYELMFERLAEIEVPLVLENVVGYSDEQFLDFYHQAKDFLGKKVAGHALDISHRYVNDWKTWLDIPKELVRDIAYVHVSDCTKTEDLHLPLGLGEMPYNDFFAFLKKIKYDGVINQELKPDGNQAGEIMSSSLCCCISRTLSLVKKAPRR